MSARRAFAGAVPRAFRIMVMSAADARGRAQVDADGSVTIEAQKEGRRIPRHELRQQEQNQQRTRHPGTLKKAILLFPSSPSAGRVNMNPQAAAFKQLIMVDDDARDGKKKQIQQVEHEVVPGPARPENGARDDLGYDVFGNQDKPDDRAGPRKAVAAEIPRQSADQHANGPRHQAGEHSDRDPIPQAAVPRVLVAEIDLRPAFQRLSQRQAQTVKQTEKQGPPFEIRISGGRFCSLAGVRVVLCSSRQQVIGDRVRGRDDSVPNRQRASGSSC